MRRTSEPGTRKTDVRSAGAASRGTDRRTRKPSTVGRLQRRVGNQAVQALHEQGNLQAKLDVSSPRDPAEREAERVADEVMRMPEPTREPGAGEGGRRPEPTRTTATVDRRANERVQRLCPRCRDRFEAGEPLNCPDCEAELDGGIEIQREASSGGGRVGGATGQAIRAARSGGRPLPESTRSFFGSRFGRDFSDVRVHTGPTADRAARSVNAEAFTTGSDVVFRSGTYRPGTPDGKRLLAHELTHVVQQGEGAAQIQRTLDSSYQDVHLPRQIACLIDKHEGPIDWVANNAPLVGKDYDDRQEQCRGISGYDGPDVPEEYLFDNWNDPWWAVAVNLNVGDPGWTDDLPSCPCTQMWADDDSQFEDETHPWTERFHPGARWDYRTTGLAPHSQQCCYDEYGRLIPDGEGAGTPDYYNPDHDFVAHQRVDVRPHGDPIPWGMYNRFWEPNDGDGCREEYLTGSDLPDQAYTTEAQDVTREDPTRENPSSGHVPY